MRQTRSTWRRRRAASGWSIVALALGLTVGASAATITVEGDVRVIRSDGLPSHETGEFPNPGNPNRIRAISRVWRVPASPSLTESLGLVPLGVFGVALNGVPFDPGAAEWWRGDPRLGWQVEAQGPGVDLGLDRNHAHVQPSGAYHYHGVPTGLLEDLGADGSRMVQVGWAADGFPIYARYGYVDPSDATSEVVPLDPSYRLRDGNRPGGENGPGGAYDGRYVQDHKYVAGAGDLDECNGRFGVTPEFPDGTYAYFVTDAYPHVPRCWKGTPDLSFARGGLSGEARPPQGGPPPHGGGPPGGHPPPPHPPFPPPGLSGPPDGAP